MRADEIIKFGIWLTGHDEETVRQMLKNWGGSEKESQPKQGMTEAEFEKAKAGSPIETVNGTPARLIYHDLVGEYNIAILVEIDVDGTKIRQRYTKEVFLQSFRLKTKREGWVALRNDKYGICVNGAIIEEEDVFDSIWGDKDFIKAHVTWEE
jgi:hypothetical protein